MLDKIKEMVEVSRTILDTLPKNNIKNSQKYIEALKSEQEKFESYKSEIQKEISKRIKKYTKFETEELNSEKMLIVKDNLYLLNNYNSSYEKLNLDKILYKLNHFYKDDLEEANSNILECINIFNQAGIKLESKDFNYSEYVNKYMQVLLENPSDNIRIKESFEEIYWQCSDLLVHIELNFKYLYYLHQKEFDKYIDTLKNQFIKQYGNNILEEYKDLVKKYDDEVSCSLSIGLNKFLNKELNISDYNDSKIDKCYAYFTEEINEEINEEISKMANSVKEYKEYLYFNYIILDISKKYKEKDKYKDVLKNKLKQIQKQEKLLIRYNKKSNKKNKINIKVINLINNLKNLYNELDNDIFYDRVYKYLNEDSSIYDALCLAASHYLYIGKCMKENEKEGSFIIEQEKLIQFILNPYNTIIKNISITDEKDIPLIICDRYKLSNFHINKEMLQTEFGINEIITNANNIEIYNKIIQKISYDNLKFIIETKDMFNR